MLELVEIIFCYEMTSNVPVWMVTMSGVLLYSSLTLMLVPLSRILLITFSFPLLMNQMNGQIALMQHNFRCQFWLTNCYCVEYWFISGSRQKKWRNEKTVFSEKLHKLKLIFREIFLF